MVNIFHLSKQDFKVPCHLLTFIEDIMKTSKRNVISPPVNVLSTFRMEKDSTETTLWKLGEIFARVFSFIIDPYV
jgi:hypothetical protein